MSQRFIRVLQSGLAMTQIMTNFQFLVDNMISMRKSPNSAFSVCKASNDDSDLSDQMQTFAAHRIEDQEPLDLPASSFAMPNLPPYLYLLIRIFAALLKSVLPESAQKQYIDTIFTNPLLTDIKITLLKVITEIIERRLYLCEEQNYFNELSYSSIFRTCLLPHFISLLASNSQSIRMQRLIEFFQSHTTSNHTLAIPLSLYNLYGGGLLNIDATIFKTQLTQLITDLGQLLSSENCFLARHFPHFKANVALSSVIELSIKIVYLFQNPSFLNSFAVKVTEELFGTSQYISKQQFITGVQNLVQYPILAFFVTLIQAQFIVIDSLAASNKLQAFGSDIGSLNPSPNDFYSSELKKILKKCPFNGDPQCHCKKCQCVRRNRESAKTAQNRKSEAAQLIGPLNKRVKQLETENQKLNKRLAQLEQELRAYCKAEPVLDGLPTKRQKLCD